MDRYIRVIEDNVLLATNDFKVLTEFFTFEPVLIECTRIKPIAPGMYAFLNKFGTITYFDTEIVVAGEECSILPYVLLTKEGAAAHMNATISINKINLDIESLKKQRDKYCEFLTSMTIINE